MELKKTNVHSPFSEQTILEGNNRSLLLQFILTEIFDSFSCYKTLLTETSLASKSDSSFFLSIFQNISPLNRIQEHASLFPLAFTNKKIEISIFTHSLSNAVHLLYNYQEKPFCTKKQKTEFEAKITSYLRQMFFLLEPFLEECKSDESFLFFLLKHHTEITLLTQPKYFIHLLHKLHPEGISSMQEYICDHFHERGFTYLIPKVKSLIQTVATIHD